MNYIDTSVCLRTISVTTAHVESDIVDASGHYKPFAKYDTLWVPDPSQQPVIDPRQIRGTHLYTCVEQNTTQEEVDAVVALDPSMHAECPRIWK